MTKIEYMTILSRKLRRLPMEDYKKAVCYFEEYFEEAGPENEQQAIHDLGSPELAANELIMNLATKTVQDPPRTVKKGVSAVWIGILGVCAAPLALPLAIGALALILAFMLMVFAFIFSLVLFAISLSAFGIIGFVGGFIMLLTSFADGVATIGLSSCAFGIGLASVYGSVLSCRWFLRALSKSLGNIVKGGKKNENFR